MGPTDDASAQLEVENFIRTHSNPTDSDYKKLKEKLKFGVYPSQICLKTVDAVNYFNMHRT